MPYCDGSAHSGDNDVVDPSFPFSPIRFHRGLRNQSAGMDLAKALFPNVNRVTVAGSSAGGDDSYTALQSPLFYSQTADGVFLNEWTDDFLVPRPFWLDTEPYSQETNYLESGRQDQSEHVSSFVH